MPMSRPGSAKTASPVCLYSVYRKQKRSLFTAALEQTSNVTTVRNVGRSSGRVRRWAYGLPYPVSGQQLRPSVTLHVCFLTGAPRHRRPGRCPPFHVPIPPTTSTDCPAASDGGRWWFPGPSSVVLPRSRSPVPSPGRFGRATASYVDRPQVAMGSRHRPEMAPGPAGDRPSPPFAPPPAIQLRSRR